MDVLVTGSTGFVGGAICDALLAQGHRVVGVARKPHSPLIIARGLQPLPSVMDFLLSDMVRPNLGEAEAELLSDIDFVVHAAGNPTFGNGSDYDESNVRLTRRLLEFLELSCPALRRIIFLSSVGAQDRDSRDPATVPLSEWSAAAPSSDYGRSKLACEELISACRFDATIFRLGMVLGSGMRRDSHVQALIGSSSRAVRYVSRGLQGRLPLVDVRDVCSAVLHVLEGGTELDMSLVVGSSPTIAEVASLGSKGQTYRLPAVSALRKCVPFRVRAMLSPELWVDGTNLHLTGWSAEHSWQQSVQEVARVVEARQDPTVKPPGLTLVTGAASGLGEALVRHLVNRELVLVDRDEGGLTRIAAEVCAKATIVADLTDGIEEQLDRVAKEHGLPYAEAFLCAGAGTKEEFGVAPARRDFTYAVDLNLSARIRITGHLLPYMRAINFGRLIFVSSSTAFAPIAGFAVYSASNAGLLSFGQALAQELKADGIQVLTVCPGGMNTNFQKSAGVRRIDGEALLEPSAVAARIINELKRPQRTVQVIGRNAKLSNVLHRILPLGLEGKLWHQLARSRR